MRPFVIGAGIGGLCLAQGLRRAGIDVTVYERDTEAVARQQGYRIHINSDGGRAGLANNLPANLYQLFLATSGRADTYTPLFDHQLNVLDGWTGAPDEEPLVVDRLMLRQILLTGIADLVRFGRSRVTLLGDAIHAMTPAGGVGANTALRDAAGLADALIDVVAGKPLESRLAEYEAAMRDYGFAAVRYSASNGVRVIGQNPLPEVHID